MTGTNRATSDQSPRRMKSVVFEAVKCETGRHVSIRTIAKSPALRMKINTQEQSPFFDLPPELRLLIYQLTLAEYSDSKNLYEPSTSYWRPGFEGSQKTDTALLLSCRKFWLEANRLPLKLATHNFWFHNGPFDLARLRQNATMLDATMLDPNKAGQERIRESTRVPTETQRYKSFPNL